MGAISAKVFVDPLGSSVDPLKNGLEASSNYTATTFD
jgi:hypothetical protein